MRTLLRKPADLAMVDLRMPDVNGLDLLRQIRTTVPGCEVILMTAYAAVDSAVEAIKLGAREYLTKPFDFDRLKQVLEDIRAELERRAQVRRAREPGGAAARVLRHARPQPGDAGSVQPHSAAGAAREGRAGQRRDRHRQGARGARVPSRGHAAHQAVRHDQLLGGRRHAVRERAVRPRARRVHRRGRIEGRRLRGGARRHAVPRRSRRAAALGAGEAAARARVRRSAARRLAAAQAGRRDGGRRHQPRSARGSRRRPVPRRPVLPPQRRRSDPAAAARSARRHPVSDRGLHARVRGADAQADSRADAGRRARAAAARGGTATSAS